MLADYEIKTKFYIRGADAECSCAAYRRAHPIHSLLFSAPVYKIMAGGPESIHLPETNSSLGTGPTFVSFRKSSTQKTGDLYEHDLGPL